MAKLGTIVCTRCTLISLQKRAEARGMTVTMRKSYYGLAKGKPGIDVYIHPKSIEIPSHFKFLHNGNPGTQEFMSKILEDSDPEKWWEAWLADIPQRCMCREASGMKGFGKGSRDWKKLVSGME